MQYLELNKIVLIGASTGGPGQIQKIIQKLPLLSKVSIIIAQHMSDGFIESFISQLQNYTNNDIILIEDKTLLQKGKIYLCKQSTVLNKDLQTFNVHTPHTNAYNPDINTLFTSFIPLIDKVEVLCAILTGIGADGVESCKQLHNNGARCMTESQKSSIIDGMPSRAREAVANIEVYEIDIIIEKISEFCQ